MDGVLRRLRSATIAESGDAARVRRLIVVAGTVAEWAGFTEAQWTERLASIGSSAAAAGVESMRIVPSSDGGVVDVATRAGMRRDVRVDGCRVVADPRPDGRANLVEAINRLSGPITEESLQKEVAASGGDVDLVIVLGDPSVLPAALVWELAYAELVYIDADWSTLSVEHIGRSLDEFAVRQRRFGGVIE
ncbi:MAG: hypothetical protein B7C54_09515 [Acidimicrobiales bacterium mtb01]|nr:hypothetical protein [Actinomycetota bacterium]TEX45328.1 MAG: hypothetical protein B7C54_09515 [Acidimicrobiales bacterium mtb01]